RFGRLDVVVNNAGYSLIGAVEELGEQELRDQLETNVFGVFHVTQAVLPVLRAQGSGHIVQISSAMGVATFAGTGGYSASKWALEAPERGTLPGSRGLRHQGHDDRTRRLRHRLRELVGLHRAPP